MSLFYLTQKDLRRTIQIENLTQICNKDLTIVDDMEQTALSEVSSYLVQKFIVSWELTPTLVYERNTDYLAAYTVYLSGDTWVNNTSYSLDDIVNSNNLIYYCVSAHTSTTGTTPATSEHKWRLLGNYEQYFTTIVPEPYYKFETNYNVGDKVFWMNKIYTATNPSIGIYPDDPQNGQQTWGSGVDYIVNSTIELTDTTYWKSSDGRSQEIIRVIMDLLLYHLHSRISPQNIPALRIKRYDDSISWLKKCAQGDITPNLLIYAKRSGGRIRIGGMQKNNNSY